MQDLFKAYKNIFDSSTIKSIWYLITHRKFEGLESPIKVGKESNVFSALTKEKKRVAVKIYRISACDFFTMSKYLSMDTRFRRVERRRQVVLTWAKREFSNLLRAYKGMVNVPMPIAIRDNVIAMEFLGTGDDIPIPLPKLKDVPVTQKLCNNLIDEIKKLYEAGLVHGDLSEFNVLSDGEKCWIIDLSHGTPLISQAANDLLDRDVDKIIRFFSKKGININKAEVLRHIKGK